MSKSTIECPNCGYANRAAATRCGLCGKPFISESAGASLAAAVFTQTPDEERAPTIAERADFAGQIAKNRLKSNILVAIIFIILLLLGLAVGNYYGFPEIGVGITAVAAIIVLTWALFGGASAILALSRARPADAVKDRQLINLVDEMRIAAGLPMPKVYVIETEALNAFATGRNPEHGIVAVTRGLMKVLNREELQGVVAHEMSHIRNYDIRFMMLVAALVGTVVLIADFFRYSLWYGRGFGRGRRSSSGGGGGGQAAAILMIIALVFIILSPIFATLLQMAVSRRREFLADASAVELTRNPLGLVSALEKIDNHIEREPLPGASKATQHIYIANPLKAFGMKSSALMSTHPPMQARIKILKAMA
ncbi:MAG: zinc metalloprotease HtpX [Calditrichaeota bacterium]|nr:zinc metalloprotease HtpX [Calditrichota bacterium]